MDFGQLFEQQSQQDTTPDENIGFTRLKLNIKMSFYCPLRGRKWKRSFTIYNGIGWQVMGTIFCQTFQLFTRFMHTFQLE
jgi:hypothetical protein